MVEKHSVITSTDFIKFWQMVSEDILLSKTLNLTHIVKNQVCKQNHQSLHQVCCWVENKLPTMNKTLKKIDLWSPYLHQNVLWRQDTGLWSCYFKFWSRCATRSVQLRSRRKTSQRSGQTWMMIMFGSDMIKSLSLFSRESLKSYKLLT